MDHDRLRAIAGPFLTARSIEQLPPFVQNTVESFVNETEERGDIDFVRNFAFCIPIAVICRILGVPVSDAELIQEMGRRVLFPPNPQVTNDDVQAGHIAVEDFKAYLKDFVVAARRDPDLDPSANLVNALVAAQKSGATLSDDELLHTCVLVLNWGHETTTNLISGALNALLDHPDCLAACLTPK